MTDARKKALERAHKAVCGGTRCFRSETLIEAIAAYEAAMLEAEHKMTPREPTDEMRIAMNHAPTDVEACRRLWDAAPSPGDNDD